MAAKGKSKGDKRSDPDFKLCKENSWCAAFYKYGNCAKGADCQYKHMKKKSDMKPERGGSQSASRGNGKGKGDGRGKSPAARKTYAVFT